MNSKTILVALACIIIVPALVWQSLQSSPVHASIGQESAYEQISLTQSDIDRIRGIVNEEIDDRQFAKSIDEVLGKLSDCNERVADLESKLVKQIKELQERENTKSPPVDPPKNASAGVSDSAKYSNGGGGSSGGSPVRSTYVQPAPKAKVASNHWTYPGPSIADHLQSKHQVSVAGLSEEEQLTLHDQIHERERAAQKVSYTQYVPPASQVYFAGQNCPGGVCPTNASFNSTRSAPLFFPRLRFRR